MLIPGSLYPIHLPCIFVGRAFWSSALQLIHRRWRQREGVLPSLDSVRHYLLQQFEYASSRLTSRDSSPPRQMLHGDTAALMR